MQGLRTNRLAVLVMIKNLIEDDPECCIPKLGDLGPVDHRLGPQIAHRSSAVGARGLPRLGEQVVRSESLSGGGVRHNKCPGAAARTAAWIASVFLTQMGDCFDFLPGCNCGFTLRLLDQWDTKP